MSSGRRPAPASSAPSDAGLAQIAQALSLAIPQEALERLAPAVRKMYADLERLRDLPLDDRIPALPPLAPVPEAVSRRGPSGSARPDMESTR